MFRGSKHVAPEEHARHVEERGGRINAFTSKDVTVYFEDVTPDALPLIIDLEAERFGNLVVTEEMLASEREVVIEERRMRTEDRPQGRAFEAAGKYPEAQASYSGDESAQKAGSRIRARWMQQLSDVPSS